MMKLKKKLILRVLFVSVIVSLVCAASLSATTGEVEITGVIFLPDSPDVGDVYPVVLADEDGEMYAISIDGKCVELIEHENKFVKLIGTVAIDKNGGKTIKVKHYEVLKDWPQGS
ncbi:MAG: hypothetical protein WBF55_09680 [Syntrophobacteria bacterium]